MQVIRQSFAIGFRRARTLTSPSSIVQQIRFDGSDPRTSTSSESHKSGSQSDSSKGSDLNKSKSGEKKERSTSTDDTNQPGATRGDWNNPNQVGKSARYGKADSPKHTDD